MHLVQAKDFEKVKAAYIDIINHTPGIADHCRWEYGKHPSDEDIRTYIEKGELYALMEHDRIAGVVAVSMSQGEDYETVGWEDPLANDQVATLHLLAVCPAFQGKALGQDIIKEALKLAKESGKKALRLDTLKTNIPAQHMYEKAGFSLRGEQAIFLEGRGWYNFLYYEKSV